MPLQQGAMVFLPFVPLVIAALVVVIAIAAYKRSAPGLPVRSRRLRRAAHRGAGADAGFAFVDGHSSSSHGGSHDGGGADCGGFDAGGGDCGGGDGGGGGGD